MKRNITEKFIRASLWTAFISYGFFALNFLGQIVLAKILFPKDYGLYAFALAIVEILNICLGFSNPSAFINSEGGQAEFNACFKLNIIAAGILLFASIVGGFAFRIFLANDQAVLFAIVCLGQMFLTIASAFNAPLQKQLDFKRIAFYRGICLFGSLCIAIVLAHYHFSYLSLGIRDFVNGIVFLVISYKICPFRVDRGFLRADHRAQLNFGINISFSRAMEVIYYRFPDFIIKIAFGKFILGNFYQARSVSYLPIKMMEPFTHQVLFSFLSQIKHDSKLISDRLSWINYILTRAYLPIIFVAYVFGKFLFVWVYGEHWVLAGEYFRFFSIWAPAASLLAAALSTAYSINKQYLATLSYFLATILFVVGVFTLPKIVMPPIIFTSSLCVGYIIMLFGLHKVGVKLPLINNFAMPILILTVTICINHYFGSNISTVVFTILYTTLLISEKNTIKRLITKVFKQQPVSAPTAKHVE